MRGRRGWDLKPGVGEAARGNLRDSSEGDRQRHAGHTWDKRKADASFYEVPLALRWPTQQPHGVGTIHLISQMKKLRLRDIKCLDRSHPVEKLWSQDRAPGYLLQCPTPFQGPTDCSPPRWHCVPRAGGGGPALPRFPGRTGHFGLVQFIIFIQQTSIAHFGVWGLVLSTEDTEMTKGKMDLGNTSSGVFIVSAVIWEQQG